MQYKLEYPTLDSRRGKYNTVVLITNPLSWKPKALDYLNARHRAVIDEVAYAQSGKLHTHMYWVNEPKRFILAYQLFYNKLFSFDWLHKNEDRHNIVVSADCCLTLVQYHNHKLIAYSRSTDMRNGYFSDRLLLNLLAEHITQDRPDCRVDLIEWHIAIPHIYEKQDGVARLLEETTET